MNILDFTVEEVNIINMYKGITTVITVNRIKEMLSYMNYEMGVIANSAIKKLKLMTELEFMNTTFTPADDQGV